MKKIFILLSVVLCTVLVGCSKVSNNSGNSNSPIVGTWVSTEGDYCQKTYTFNANGTFTETTKYYEEVSEEVNRGTYSYNAPELDLYYNDGHWIPLEATISGDTLTMSNGEIYYRNSGNSDNSGGSDNSDSTSKSIIGTWLYDDSEEGSIYQVILNFNTNSNFTMTVNTDDESNSINGSYTYNAPELSLYANNGESMFVHATISGNILTWTNEGESIIFYRQ